MFTIEMQYFICSLTVWRLTHLFVSEDGPWDFVFHLRKKLGNSIAGKAMDCFYCFSIWMAALVALIISNYWSDYLLCWISLSGAACLLERFTGININKENSSSQKNK
ncbi:MAG: hypothetical protein ABI772_07085 [Bacteroidota bacterium]